jgi:hypothetical protein
MNSSTLFHYFHNHKTLPQTVNLSPIRDGKASIINRLQSHLGKRRMPFGILARPLQCTFRTAEEAAGGHRQTAM